MVERIEVEELIQDHDCRREVCLGGKRLLHLDLWRCEVSINTSSVWKSKWIREFILLGIPMH